MKEIVLYGAGGHCFAAIELINSLAEYQPKVIYDDAPSVDRILGIPVKVNSEKNISGRDMCITIGDNKIRQEIANAYNVNYPNFIHKSAVVYPSASVGKGTVLLPNSVIDAASQIGNFCIVNNNATVSHNVEVGDFCHIAINVAIAGGVSIGVGTLVGAGSVILPEIKVGKWAVIGAGAVVTEDVPDYAVVVGQPAKIIKYNES